MNCAKACALLGDHLEGDLDLPIRTAVDVHLAECDDCHRQLRELRTTVAMLRSLRDPVPPASLLDGVMEQLREGDSHAPALPTPLRRVFHPWVAVPLAAGISALVLFSTLESPAPDGLARGPATDPASGPYTTAQIDPEEIRMWDDMPQTLDSAVRQRGRAIPVQLVAIEGNDGIRFRPRPSSRVGFIGRTDPDPQGLDLDAQIDGAIRDPLGFLDHVSRVSEPERGSRVHPLVVRAGRRGDADRVAGRLRAASHPLARSMAESFDRSRRFEVQSRGNSMAVPVSHQAR